MSSKNTPYQTIISEYVKRSQDDRAVIGYPTLSTAHSLESRTVGLEPLVPLRYLLIQSTYQLSAITK